MDVSAVFLWGFIATIVLSLLTIGAQAFGLTRIDFPFILGTLFTSDRDRAHFLGYVLHLVNGWIFAFAYVAIFEHLHFCSWWLGAVLGALHGLSVVLILLPALPGLHPRMVSDFRGPEPTRLLQPPGFLGLNYGKRTPWALVSAHVVYGALLGALYSFH
jgi:hypothetical protein